MGICHHSNYICYYEAARSSFMRWLGVSYAEMEARGVMMPIWDVPVRNTISPRLLRGGADRPSDRSGASVHPVHRLLRGIQRGRQTHQHGLHDPLLHPQGEPPPLPGSAVVRRSASGPLDRRGVKEKELPESSSFFYSFQILQEASACSTNISCPLQIRAPRWRP